MQHQRYLELYGASPATGEAFEDLSTHARQLSHDVVDARGQVVALQFSAAVEASYGSATAQDHQPLNAAAEATRAAARAADTSAEINRRGVADISGNAREELAQIEAVPDPDSPEGQAAILAIIGQHQAKASQTVTDSATAELAAGQQAANGGSGSAPGGQAAGAGVPMSPDDVIVGNPTGPHIQMVDTHTGPSPAPSPSPQIGPFPVPPQVAAAAGPPPQNPFLDQYQQSLTGAGAPPAAPPPPMPAYQSPPPPPPPPFGQCVSEKVKPDLGKHMVSDGFESALTGALAGGTTGAALTPEALGAGGIPGAVLGFVGGFAKGAFEAPIKETLKGVGDCAAERAGF